jgi:glyoxylase I family protein
MPITLENVGIAVRDLEDLYKLTYLRGPSGILVMLAEDLQKS